MPTLFYGVGWIVLGYLIFISRYLPKWLGAFMAFGGVCFALVNSLLILAPTYASQFFILPMIIAMLAFAGWLLIRGVDESKWPAEAGMMHLKS